MTDSDHYFLLFSNCIIVNGTSRSIICDLQRGKYHPIPNALSEILEKHKEESIKEMLGQYNKEDRATIQSYFDFLDEQDLIYYSTTLLNTQFPPLDLSWDYPSEISNAIIEIKTNTDTGDLYHQLSDLGCDFIEVRILENITISRLQTEIVASLENTKIQLIDIYVPFDIEIRTEDLLSFLERNPVVHNLIIYNSPENHFNISNHNCVGYLYYSTLDLAQKAHCGKIGEEYFAVNIPHYTESLAHNTCLNRKISIDANGNIRNCPSMKESFGNIKNTSLEEALNKPSFKKYWDITKNEITKCKDCEFRHICTDCSAYLEDPDDIYSAPLKCGYDPITCKWEEWSLNPLKEKSIEYYELTTVLK